MFIVRFSQASPGRERRNQLHAALLVFENELIEDAMPAPTDQESCKSEKTWFTHACVFTYVSTARRYRYTHA